MPSTQVTNVPFIPVAPKLYIGTSGSGVAIECAAEDIDLSPEQDENTVETFCSITTSYKPEKWTLTASVYLSYGTTGLWTAVRPLCGTVQPFTLVPDRAAAISVDNPMATGNAYVKGFPFYSAAVGSPNAVDLILAVRGTPTFPITGTVPTMMAEFGEDGQPLEAPVDETDVPAEEPVPA